MNEVLFCGLYLSHGYVHGLFHGLCSREPGAFLLVALCGSEQAGLAVIHVAGLVEQDCGLAVFFSCLKIVE